MWKDQWEECTGDAYEMAQQLLDPQQTDAVAVQQQPNDAPDLGSLTFQIRGGGRPSAKMALLRVAAGVAAGELASQ